MLYKCNVVDQKLIEYKWCQYCRSKTDINLTQMKYCRSKNCLLQSGNSCKHCIFYTSTAILMPCIGQSYYLKVETYWEDKDIDLVTLKPYLGLV